MAGRHLKEIFRAFHARDELAFRRAATEIIEEEQAKHHHALARDLQKLLVAGGPLIDTGASLIVPAPPKDREGDWDLAEIKEPDRLLGELVLDSKLLRTMKGLIAEVHQWPTLDAAGVPRRQRLLLEGPPGCGKTTAAEALATELGRPFLLVRLDAVVSSYLGETASNLRRILEYADKAPFVASATPTGRRSNRSNFRPSRPRPSRCGALRRHHDGAWQRQGQRQPRMSMPLLFCRSAVGTFAVLHSKLG
jgi:hypothetical protein